MSTTALITGATSGIGAAFAAALAGSGHDLILTGRRAEKLAVVASSIESTSKVGVEVRIIDLSEQEARANLIAEVSGRTIDVLVNNAGFGLASHFGGTDVARHLEMVDVHVRSAVELVAAVLPGMKEIGSGAIINVASVAAFFPMPNGATYSSTKAFLVSFSESLAMELASDGIRVQALCPGLTHTDFHSRMGEAGDRIKRLRVTPWMSAEAVVDRSLRALRRNRVVCITGAMNSLIVRLFSRLPRRLYYRLMSRARV